MWWWGPKAWKVVVRPLACARRGANPRQEARVGLPSFLSCFCFRQHPDKTRKKRIKKFWSPIETRVALRAAARTASLSLRKRQQISPQPSRLLRRRIRGEAGTMRATAWLIVALCALGALADEPKKKKNARRGRRRKRKTARTAPRAPRTSRMN